MFPTANGGIGQTYDKRSLDPAQFASVRTQRILDLSVTEEEEHIYSNLDVPVERTEADDKEEREVRIFRGNRNASSSLRNTSLVHQSTHSPLLAGNVTGRQGFYTAASPSADYPPSLNPFGDDDDVTNEPENASSGPQVDSDLLGGEEGGHEVHDSRIRRSSDFVHTIYLDEEVDGEVDGVVDERETTFLEGSWDNDRDSQAGGARGNSTGGLEKTMTDLGEDGDDRVVDRPLDGADGKVRKTAEEKLKESLARRDREARERDSRWLEEGREGYNLRSRAPPK